MRDFWKEPETKKINKKKIIFTAIIGVILISVITTMIIYVKNRQFREWFDTVILRKEVNQDKLATIEIKEEEKPQIYAFNQYIAILQNLF